MKIKLLMLNFVLLNSAFALSMGDVVTSETLQTETNSKQVMKLAVKDDIHSEYVIKSADGSRTVLVNNNSQVYGFNWNTKNPNIKDMLGAKYLQEFNNAYNNRLNKGSHRMLSIETTNLSVHQFGLPSGIKEGEMVDKSLAPKN